MINLSLFMRIEYVIAVNNANHFKSIEMMESPPGYKR